MLNRISRKLWPIEYWHNKKKQFIAGRLNGRRIWMASGAAFLAIAFVVTVVAGILTSRSYQQAQHIPLRPLSQEQLPLISDSAGPAETAAKPITPSKVVEEAAVAPSPVVQASPTTWPVSGDIKLEFGWQQHPVLKDWIYHTGVDISAAIGQPVKAAMGGKVTELRQDPQTGLTVIVTAGIWTVHHGVLAAAAVKSGDIVSAGQIIGTSGESFREHYPHVHLTIEKNGEFVNPVDILPGRSAESG